MSTLLIKNGTIYDGLGGEPYQASIYIEDGKIKEIGSEIKKEAGQVIDADGYAVTPGFIDIHRHCDNKPFYGTEYGDVILAQGITTVVVGNCGISMTPCNQDLEQAREMYEFDEPVLGPACDQGIFTFHDYMRAMDQMELPVNVASMIGTGSVKITIKGFSNTPYTPLEIKQAKDLIENAMKEGAPGISVGIMYIPECYSSTAEFAEILEPVGRYGGVVTAHIRGEGDSMVDSVREIIEIGEKAGCAIEISHFKSCGMGNWQKEIHRAIALIEAARSKGMDITCDFYPYEGGSTSLTTMLPPVFVNGDMKKALAKLGTQQGIAEFRESSRILYDDWDNFAITLGWDRILVSGVTKRENEKFLGLSVTQAAENFGFDDAAACAAYLMHQEDGKVAIINMSMHQDDIDTVAKLPYSIVISDSIYADTKTPHPRLYGAFPKIIREYVNERKIYTLPEAIKKMTSLPAKRMRLHNRGCIKTGYWADINVFDPLKFRDYATFSNPAQMAGGLYCCIVNGNIAVKDDQVEAGNYGQNIRVR